MPPQLDSTDKQDGETEEKERESDEDEEEEDGPNPHMAEMEAKARVVQLRDKALAFWNKDEWENIMNMYTNESFFDTLLCWIRPTRDFLSFLHAELRRLHVTKIVSVGCGCGFLEWLIKRACSGIQVVGYEVDRGWWQGRYGVKPFIEHIYIDEVKTRHVAEDTVLMTCYFHSWECWNQYLAEFRGDLVIVIGPDTNSHVTFPEPRHVLSDPRFVLESERNIDGGDKIVVMRRNPEQWPVPPPPPEPAADAPPLPSVKPPEDKAEKVKRYNEMRRSFVIDRIGNAKQNPKPPPPVDPKVRQGPASRSTYTTRKPSLAFSLGSSSVASRMKNLGGAAPGGMKRSASCSAHLESLGKSPESKPAPRRKTTAPAGAGRAESSRTSSRASGTVTPDGRGKRSAAGQRLGVVTAFAGRPLRESRSVPSLATLQERTEHEPRHGDGSPTGEQEHDGQESSARRRRTTRNDDDDQQPTENGTRRRRETNGQSQQNGVEGVDSHRRRTAEEGRRQRTKPTEEQPSNCEPELNGWGAEQSHGTTDGHEDVTSRGEQSVKLSERGASPPLVTITDLSSERRGSLRRPSWSLFSGSPPSH